MQQEQKIKGFTILELLVVITIVSIVSAIGYPRFNDWKTDREVRQALERAASMVNSIITHTQRGSYPYVQIDIRSSQTQTIFTTKGMSKNKFSNSLNQKDISINSLSFGDPNFHREPCTCGKKQFSLEQIGYVTDFSKTN